MYGIMNRYLSVLLLVNALFFSACPGGAGGESAEGEGEGEGEGDGESGPILDEMLPAAAVALCDALYRCCPSDEEIARFFAVVANGDPDGIFADVIPKLPPNAALSIEECPAVVTQIHTIKGVGPFVAAARDGLIDYDSSQAEACINGLDTAACGDDVANALFDGTCFGLGPPDGGEQQRSMFSRDAAEGLCRPLADGFGGLFYGTCDPVHAFCCVDQGDGQCGFPGGDDTGECVSVAPEGAACTAFNPVLLCATGLECVPGAGPNGGDGCVAKEYVALVVGEICYDVNGLGLLGFCEQGWCDVTGSNACEASRDDGEVCQTPDQCRSRGCIAGVCGLDDFCSGN